MAQLTSELTHTGHQCIKAILMGDKELVLVGSICVCTAVSLSLVFSVMLYLILAGGVLMLEATLL